MTYCRSMDCSELGRVAPDKQMDKPRSGAQRKGTEAQPEQTD